MCSHHMYRRKCPGSSEVMCRGPEVFLLRPHLPRDESVLFFSRGCGTEAIIHASCGGDAKSAGQSQAEQDGAILHSDRLEPTYSPNFALIPTAAGNSGRYCREFRLVRRESKWPPPGSQRRAFLVNLPPFSSAAFHNRT